MNVNSNLGWYYYRDYFHGQDLSDTKIREKGKEKSILESERTENEYKDKNNDLVHTVINTSTLPTYFKLVGSLDNFSLKTIYPGLLVGAGYTHEVSAKGELKLGLFFDHTTGLPIISGSSIKGVLRSAFPQWNEKNDSKTPVEYKKVKTRWIKSILTEKPMEEIEYNDSTHKEIDELELCIFEGIKDDSKIKPDKRFYSIYERDIFHDAYIDEKENTKIVGLDSITPHRKDGMSLTMAMLKNPIPIPFLKILPGITFCFNFSLTDNGQSKTVKERLFKEIILSTGLGAKTNVGYGQFATIPVNKNEPQPSEMQNQSIIRTPQAQPIPSPRDIIPATLASKLTNGKTYYGEILEVTSVYVCSVFEVNNEKIWINKKADKVPGALVGKKVMIKIKKNFVVTEILNCQISCVD